MKFTLSFEGDLHEERDYLKSLAMFMDYSSCLYDIQEAIRSRRKHHEITPEEENFLSELSTMIYQVVRD